MTGAQSRRLFPLVKLAAMGTATATRDKLAFLQWLVPILLSAVIAVLSGIAMELRADVRSHSAKLQTLEANDASDRELLREVRADVKALLREVHLLSPKGIPP